MPGHPCEKGLTASCFAAYPNWAKQAVAYKLIHLLVPKQLTARLPGIIKSALIGPGATLPPGFEFPPGWVIPPDFGFPPEWHPEDPMPLGVQPDPKEKLIIPPGGPAPPINVAPFVPGPPTPVAGRTGAPAKGPSLLWESDPGVYLVEFGHTGSWLQTACWFVPPLNCQLTSVKLRTRRYGTPPDNVMLEILSTGEDEKPKEIIESGEATPVVGTTIPLYGTSDGWVTYTFPNKPFLEMNKQYFLNIYRTGENSTSHWYYFLTFYTPATYSYTKVDYESWSQWERRTMEHKIWGIET